MITDKDFCASSFLALRHIYNHDYRWCKDWNPRFKTRDFSKLDRIYNVVDMHESIEKQLRNINLKKTGVMLSGGMDSAILASYLPKGSNAYTMRALAKDSVNEVEQAKRYADVLGLNLKIVDITWEDYENYIPILLENKKSPFHSIEPQIYKTLLSAKHDGCDYVLCGENADSMFGGMDGLLSKDWLYEDFINRYCYIDPFKVLNNPIDISQAFMPYKRDNYIDMHGFISHVFAEESLNSYLNPAECTDINLVMPFANMLLEAPLDLVRIRNGESKYLIRELFKIRYNCLEPNKKLPMPRAVGVWLKDWIGPKRYEFKSIDIKTFTPDQKWLMYILERFLNLIDKGK